MDDFTQNFQLKSIHSLGFYTVHILLTLQVREVSSSHLETYLKGEISLADDLFSYIKT